MKLIHCLIIPQLFRYSQSAATPMYIYIKELCPPGLMPLTGARHVRTCDDRCPRGSSCIQGICCTHPPQCNHFTYKYPSKYSCLPRVKQNCPEGHKCVASTHEGMHICCSAKPPRAAAVPREQSICPASHPLISSNGQQLRLCEDCEDGVCVPFRSSSVSICCHSSTTFCGEGSAVEIDGLLARDCSKLPCSQGYECSLSPFGSRICCSLAECPSGGRARAICAAGCRRDEVCEEILDQRWCCPAAQKRCPANRRSNGAVCSSDSPNCDVGFECVLSEGQQGHLCCEADEQEHTTPIPRAKKFSSSTLKSTTAVTIGPFLITLAPSPVIAEIQPRCLDGEPPLLMDGEYLQCPQLRAPCPKAGFVCQAVIGGLYCCPTQEEIVETTTIPFLTFATTSPEECTDCDNKVAEQRPPPSCPFAFREARHDVSDEIKTCAGFLDFSCPFGFTCLPSSTTPSFLCCAQVIDTSRTIGRYTL